MKRYTNLWAKICDYDNLVFAHQCAQQDKKYYKEVQMVNENPELYLNQIRQMLLNKTYVITTDDYTVSEICDKGKMRELRKLSYFPHRIIQWAILLQIEKIFMDVFCNHTCASIKFKGITHAYKLMVKYLRDKENSKYCLKLDIEKFYPNINHAVLKQLLRKKFKDTNLLEVLDMIIDSHPGEVGLPIGSYLSQFLANYYLAYFDHWAKENLHLKMIIRYMDDIIILGPTTEYLRSVLKEVTSYLSQELRLKIKSNWQIFPVDVRGVDFVGYRFFHNYILLRKSTCKRFKRKLKRIAHKQDNTEMLTLSEFCSVGSYIGWLLRCNSWRLFEKYVEPVFLALILYHKNVIHKSTNISKRKLACKRYQRHLHRIKYQIAKELSHHAGHGNCSRVS